MLTPLLRGAKRALLGLLCVAALGACDVPQSVAPTTAAPALASYGSYWRDGDTLVVYDARPEVGIGAHQIDAQVLSQVKEMGMGLMRLTLYWGLVDWEMDGVYDAAQLEKFTSAVRAAEVAGIRLLVVVHANPGPAKWENWQASYEAFADFLSDMQELHPSVDHWQLWNEQDAEGWTDLFGIKNGLSSFEQGRQYAKMLKLAYPALHSKNPEAWVVVGPLTGKWDFLRGMYAEGARQYFDAFSFHVYGAVPEGASRGAAPRRIMDESGDAGKPIWVTEFGASALSYNLAWGAPHQQGLEDGPTYDQYQSDWWREVLEENRTTGMFQKMLGYQFMAVDGGAVAGCRPDQSLCWPDGKLPEGHTGEDYSFGVVRSDKTTPRPVYEMLRGWQYNAALDAEPVRTMDVWVERPDVVPQGYAYEIVAPGLIRIRDVPVTRYGRTTVPFVPAPPAEDDPADPRIIK